MFVRYRADGGVTFVIYARVGYGGVRFNLISAVDLGTFRRAAPCKIPEQAGRN